MDVEEINDNNNLFYTSNSKEWCPAKVIPIEHIQGLFRFPKCFFIILIIKPQHQLRNMDTRWSEPTDIPCACAHGRGAYGNGTMNTEASWRSSSAKETRSRARRHGICVACRENSFTASCTKHGSESTTYLECTVLVFWEAVRRGAGWLAGMDLSKV